MDTAIELTAAMQAGRLASEALIEHCLEVIDKTDTDIKAWAYIDHNAALEQARAMDRRRQQGKAMGQLHGLPIGLKDIIDTSTLPTQRGSAIYQGRQPTNDAAIVERLLEQGAIILGKTVTTELAWMNESQTRNPHNLAHSPGGSSSGSAAAVAAGHVPLAVGTQTGGSVIRPASFNGVYGFKPSRGIIPRRGVMQTSPTLDQIGVFARDAGDMALLVDAIKGYDSTDSMSYLAPRPSCLEGYQSSVPVEPHFVWIDMPYRDRYSTEMQAASEEAIAAITDSPAQIDRIAAPQSFVALIECHKIIYDYEIYRSLSNEWQKHKDKLSAVAVEGLSKAEQRSDDQYSEALEIMNAANTWFDTFFNDYDAILTPAANGVAPKRGTGTGDPINCIVWTLCGLPCISLPLLKGDFELPMGLQLIGGYDQDDRLLRTTRWLVDTLTSDSDSRD